MLKLKEGLEVEVKALEGEEEADFLEKAQGSINERRAKGGKNHQRGRRGGGRGGRGHRGEATYFVCVKGFYPLFPYCAHLYRQNKNKFVKYKVNNTALPSH